MAIACLKFWKNRRSPQLDSMPIYFTSYKTGAPITSRFDFTDPENQISRSYKSPVKRRADYGSPEPCRDPGFYKNSRPIESHYQHQQVRTCNDCSDNNSYANKFRQDYCEHNNCFERSPLPRYCHTEEVGRSRRHCPQSC